MKLTKNSFFNYPIFSTENNFFEGEFTVKVSNQKENPKQINYEVSSSVNTLNENLKSGMCNLMCNIECKSPALRFNYQIKEIVGVINLPNYEYLADIEISFIIVATKDYRTKIKVNEAIIVEYEIKRHQIMGYYRSSQIYIGNEVNVENFIEIQRSEDSYRSYAIEENRLVISLTDPVFNSIYELRENKHLSSILMLVVVQPAITYLVSEYCHGGLIGTELYYFLKNKIGNVRDDLEVARYVDMILNDLEKVAVTDLLELWRNDNDN